VTATARDPADWTGAISTFLRRIGLSVTAGAVPDGFLPGIAVTPGGLVVDRGRLAHPGDLLHEAGHLAVLPPARRADPRPDDLGDPGAEIAAIAWSWAAARHLDVPDRVLFHDHGYKGEAAWLAATFRAGQAPGLPLLQWMGLAARPEAIAAGAPAYPRLVRWLRA